MSSQNHPARPLRILIFRSFWYPDNGPGTRRIEAFAKRLAIRGHNVTFLALKPAGITDISPQIPGCRTILLSNSIRPNSFFRRIERRLGRWFPQSDFYFMADALIERAAADLLSREPFDCIATTCQPLSSFIIANHLYRRFGIPWIGDLRDLPDQFDPTRKNILVRIRAYIMEKTIKTAAHLTTVSPPLREALVKRYSPKCGISVVFNGYDEGDYTYTTDHDEAKTFDIAYFGIIYAGRSLQLLQEGLDLIVSRGIQLNGVQIRLYGKINLSELNLNPKSVSTPLFLNAGFISHTEAISAMKSSAVLISLASPGAKGILTSKIFEYAVSGRPVLSIPCDNDVLDEFINDTRIGRPCETAQEVADFLGNLIVSWRDSGQLPKSNPDTVRLEMYSRHAQADVFAEILENACIASPAAHKIAARD